MSRVLGWSGKYSGSVLACLITSGLLSVCAEGVAQETATRATASPSPVLTGSGFLTVDFHRSRRELVLAKLPADAVAIILGHPTRNRSADVDHTFRQSSDLLYLSGAPDPGSALVLVPGGVHVDGKVVTEILFVPSSSPHHETWTGPRLSPGGAESAFGVAFATEASRFNDIVSPLLRERRLVTLPLPRGVDGASDLARQIEVLQRAGDFDDAAGMERRVLDLVLQVDSDARLPELKARVQAYRDRGWFASPETKETLEAFLAAPDLQRWRHWKAEHYDAKYVDTSTLRRILDHMRSVKTREELGVLRRAIDITTSAHREAFRSAEPGMHEYELEAVIEYVFRREGSSGPAFPSIVGSGENSLILHYEANSRTMKAGDVVVMDIGAEYGGYAADVTRTIPVSGVFSAEQRAIYEIVLEASEVAVRAARAGADFGTPSREGTAVVAKRLADLGLLADSAEVSRFLPHPLSHYLGLDVHDVGAYGTLQAGNVITVEPGIYIRPANDIDPKWWNIGVRLEDDVLITDGDPIVLSGAAPRTVRAIETLMRETGIGNRPAGY